LRVRVKSLPNIKELTGRRTRARARLPGEFPLRKHPRNPVFVDEDRSNQTLVVLAAEQVVSLSR